jgi:hypothetical protein
MTQSNAELKQTIDNAVMELYNRGWHIKVTPPGRMAFQADETLQPRVEVFAPHS